MNSRLFRFFVIFSCLLASVACTPNGVKKATMGTALGTGAGVAACSNIGKGNGRTAAMAVCGIIGAIIGNSIGSSMDATDRMQLSNTLERVPAGQTVSWVNNGKTSYVMPTSTTFNDSGRHCRKYQMRIIVDGNAETGEGTACRRNDGYWDI